MNVFLPCRLGSERIPNKNVKKFADVKDGLLSIKMNQLLSCPEINNIFLSSNDNRVLEYASSLKNEKIILDVRPDYLGRSATSTDELIEYVADKMPEGDILWTHVTSPFIDGNDYSNVIKEYYLKLEVGFDSLMTAKEIRGFVWSDNKPISYSRDIEKWPRTQTITPMYEIDSGIFINSKSNYNKYNDRIGNNPYILPNHPLKSLDIDWPDDFDLAESIWESRKTSKV